MNRHNHSHSQNTAPRGRPVSSLEEAHANNSFEHFLTASTLKTIFGTYRNICEYLHLKPNVIPLFYPKLKTHVNSWKAKPLWKKFDARANHKCYGRGKNCPNTRVLIIGAGPCGLRTAIEAQLLGAKVVVIEKRDRLSRNNVLHLWPFVIDDLRALGAKKFFGKFCAGAIDHISIRQLQCILLKVALLLGVEIHTEISFEDLIEPNPAEKTGWRAQIKPADHPVSQYEFDVIIGADGKRNTLQGFKRKEFRGKLAIAITANFINKRTEAEARVEEISGVAFIFNQKFFKDLYAETGIDLENIVYYKDDTHYFVMTAKKQSLIDKGVIKQDLSDTERLLAPDNVDREELMNYAREAAEFSTNYQMPDLEFAVNHYGQPDVAMFDFTSMYAADNASRIIDRHGYRLLSILVGDSLLEPFWPTGSGCARGFLSSMDAAWAIRGWGSGIATPLEVVAERESIYRLLAQTTPENLNKDYKSYTLDPSTRYPNLNKNALLPHQVTNLYDTDNPKNIELKPRPVLTNVEQLPKKRRRHDSHVDPDTLLSWIKDQVREHEDLKINDITTSFKDGRVLCAILHHYRPDLLDFTAMSNQEPAVKNQQVFDLLEKELGIPPVMTGEELVNTEVPDFLTMLSYLSQVYDTFRCEIPHIKHPKLELPEVKRSDSTLKSHTSLTCQNIEPVTLAQPARPSSRHKRHIDPNVLGKSNLAAVNTQDRKARKRKTLEKVGASVEDRQKRLEEIASNRVGRQNKRRQQRKMQTEQFIKSMQMLQSNCKPDHSEPFEDYSIFLYRQTAPNFEDRVKDLERKFTYVPDRENRVPPGQMKRETDEDFAARIKDLEDKWREPATVEKKPKDLLRAIGKIETSDWNIKEIEKKIIENKLGKAVNKDKEKVPKWSREQFLARQNKMERQHLERQDSTGGKFAEIDKNIKQLDHKLKEGTTRDLNQRKVASITEKLVGKISTEPPPQAKPVQKSNSRVVIPPPNHGSEYCHFCSKRVYLMERLSAEGKFFHRGCFRCQYCQTLLRLGSYSFDREGLYGNRFYCPQHFGMPGELRAGSAELQNTAGESPEKNVISCVVGVDLLDRVQTPERVKFSNLSTGYVSSDHEESPSPIDEDEWTDRNFRNSVVDTDSSEDDSSSSSDTDSEDDEAFEEALEEPPTKEGTMRWAERYKKRYSRKHDDDSESDEYSSSDHFSYYENSSGEDESDTATEGEEEIRARELRKQEVRVEPPVTDTGTDTEVKPPVNSNNTFVDHNSPYNSLVAPDLLKNTLTVSNKSSDNLSVNSTEFNSAESELDDAYKTDDLNKTNFESEPAKQIQNNATLLDDLHKTTFEETLPKEPPRQALAKSATTSSINASPKVKRNFVLPPKKSEKTFGKDFIPSFKATEPEPLLIIKRTPSKVNLPPEPGKPKIALKANVSDAKKYFGGTEKKRSFSKPVLPKPQAKLIKQASLPERKTLEKENKSKELNFNFEPEDADIKEIDNYIENLLQNKDELWKPAKIEPEPQDDKVSSSIEDLLKALETETKVEKDELVAIQPEEKIDDLLTWMEELNHQGKKTKITRSLSSAKYKNLEQTLKTSQQAEVVNKLPQRGITLFEQHLAGKGFASSDSDDEKRPGLFQLKKSKTEALCADLDATKKVDVRKVLEKFERNESEDREYKPKREEIVVPKNIVKRNSFANFSLQSRSFDEIDDETRNFFSRHRLSMGAKDFKLKAEMFERRASGQMDLKRTKYAGQEYGAKKLPNRIKKFFEPKPLDDNNNNHDVVQAEDGGAKEIGGIEHEEFRTRRDLSPKLLHDGCDVHSNDNNNNNSEEESTGNEEEAEGDSSDDEHQVVEGDVENEENQKPSLNVTDSNNESMRNVDPTSANVNIFVDPNNKSKEHETVSFLSDVDRVAENVKELDEIMRNLNSFASVVEQSSADHYIPFNRSVVEDKGAPQPSNEACAIVEKANKSDHANDPLSKSPMVIVREDEAAPPENIQDERSFADDKVVIEDKGLPQPSNEVFAIVEKANKSDHENDPLSKSPMVVVREDEAAPPENIQDERSFADEKVVIEGKGIPQPSNEVCAIVEKEKKYDHVRNPLSESPGDSCMVIEKEDEAAPPKKIRDAGEKVELSANFDVSLIEPPTVNNINQESQNNFEYTSATESSQDPTVSYTTHTQVVYKIFAPPPDNPAVNAEPNSKNLVQTEAPRPPRRARKESQPSRPEKQKSLDRKNEELKPPAFENQKIRSAGSSPVALRRNFFQSLNTPPVPPQRKKSPSVPRLDDSTNRQILNTKSNSAENVSSSKPNDRRRSKSKEKECCIQIASDETTTETSSDEIQNSATEISTDSEFAQDDPTPTHDKPPSKIFDDFVTKTRGNYSTPKKVQVKSGVLQQPVNGRTTKNIELKFTPLVSTPTPPPVVRKPAAPPTSLFGRTEGYALNRTQSTGGIAAKVSLELKKKYLLGESGSTGSIQKSGSASTLDLKFKSFHTNITDCQKLLKPAPEISASMQVFCSKLSERTSPLSPTFGSPLVPPSAPGETVKTIVDNAPSSGQGVVMNESEGRPRSPVHERSIVVPTIDWEKNKQQNKDKYVDSLSSSSSDSEAERKSMPKVFGSIPRLEVHDDSGEILHDDGEMTLDSLNAVEITSINEPPKSIAAEKKTLNQPKALPDLEGDSVLPEVHSALHIAKRGETEETDSKSLKNSSGRTTPSINDDLVTTALTETELSDWARDGNVSDDLEDELLKPDKKIKGKKTLELDDLEHVCGREKTPKHPVTECVNNILYLNLENIEFMDTGTETSSDDNFEVKNNGYVQFHDEDEFLEDSLSPGINHVIETTNPTLDIKNTGYCEIDGDHHQQETDATLPENKNNDVKQVKASNNNEDDSLVVVETGTTTEENTCSDSTVKNLTEKVVESIKEEEKPASSPDTQKLIENSFKDRKRLEDKLAQVKLDMAKLNDLKTTEHRVSDDTNVEFEEHCQRLQSKIEFSNVKDSIDIRKSRRKSKSEPVKPDLIQEEKERVSPQKTPVLLTPSKLYSKEEIEKERNLNQQLIQEMVMTKMRAQNKSLERKKRNRNSFSPIRPFELSRSATTDLSAQTPDVLLSTISSVPLQKSQTVSSMNKPDALLVVSSDTINLPDVSRTSDELFVTPKAPPRTKNDEAKRTAEKMKQDARARARLMSDEEFGLSPEDKLDKLRQVAGGIKKHKENSNDIQDSIESLVINTERRNSLLYNDTLRRNTSFRRSKSTGETQSSFDLSVVVKSPSAQVVPVRTKSVSEINRSLCLPSTALPDGDGGGGGGSTEASRRSHFCKSDPNLLLDGGENQKEKKKSKDRERRKSITKFLADIFSPKKKDVASGGTTNKNFLSRISSKSKSKSKSCVALDQDNIDKTPEEKALRRSSASEMDIRGGFGGNTSPPPVPPLPENYSAKDESSDAENEFRHQSGGTHSSCDTLDQSGPHEGSISSFSGRRSGRSARKAVRQAQLKRHRMAQEIQRKLEETEVKTRELERRGVMVEKALRGEVENGRDEPDLLKEWFDLMRDRTDLRRYERELTVRAQELELEDRHARLQHELRDRLEKDEPKTNQEMEIEGTIIKEMMDIVAKRDSLIAQIEEDRIRYAEEDRDFEEQMLAKGINLTPLVKSPADGK